MRVLVVTNLFPNNREPRKGVFNQQQIQALNEFCEVKVIAPVPWAPKFTNAHFSKVIDKEFISGLEVMHPRYLVTPRCGRAFYGRWYYCGIRKLIKRLRSVYPFDIIFATWGYPDIYGAAMVAKEIGIPIVGRVHGSDVNILGKGWIRRRLMKKGFDACRSILTNSNALSKKVIGMGVDSNKVICLQNGVDKDVFHKTDKDIARQNLGLDQGKRHILFIGNLVKVKGIKYLIAAMTHLDDQAHLHILGDGQDKEKLLAQVKGLKCKKMIHFHGSVEHSKLIDWYNAADVLCLPSLAEGCPNVVLESLACGTPVVASNVGGLPELINDKSKGMLVSPANSHALADSLKIMIHEKPQKQNLSESIVSWKGNAASLYDILKKESYR